MGSSSLLLHQDCNGFPTVSTRPFSLLTSQSSTVLLIINVKKYCHVVFYQPGFFYENAQHNQRPSCVIPFFFICLLTALNVSLLKAILFLTESTKHCM